MDHFDHWQVGYIIEKGSYGQLRATGLPALRRSVAELAPELADRVGHLQDWKQGSLLSVESDRLRRWYRPGLLLIGDAAHVMSPVGGVGINYAIQDAVVAANVLAGPLRRGQVGTAPLVRVQLERELPTRVIQALQNLLQRRLLVSVRQDQFVVIPPWLLRTPVLRDLPARLLAFGLWRVHPGR